jgi:hypothetical protein
MRLDEIARVVRGKNAGPFGLTIDLLFDSPGDLARAAQAPSLSTEAIAAAYGIPPGDVTVIEHPASRALKIALRRPTPAGALDDRDLYGAQQHVPLLSAEIP